MSEVPLDDLLPGDLRQVGPYRVLRRLGDGGMGVVYLASWSGTDREVAVKVIHPAFAAAAKYRARFAREVRTAMRVRSRHTARVLDAELDTDTLYVVTEVIGGTTLTDLAAGTGIDAERLLPLAKDTAQALLDIHEHKIVHRDLKPSNVMVADGRATVIDFGIAADLSDLGGVTTTNHVLGTLPYLAPELIDPNGPRRASPASDVFSWGCMVYYAATGRAAFSGASTTLVQRAPDLSGVPGAVRDLVARSLDKRPDRRPSVRDILGDLDTVGAKVVLCGESRRSYTAQLRARLLDSGLAVRVSADPDSLADASVLVLVVSERPDPAVRDMRLAARGRGVTVLPVLVGGHSEPDAFLDARTGALPDATHLRRIRELAAREQRSVPVRGLFDPAIAAIAAELAAGDLVTADRHTTAVLLAAAGCAERGWAGPEEVAAIGADLLRDCAHVWEDGTGGDHGFLAQRRLMADGEGTEVADLAACFGWGDPARIAADYGAWVATAGAGFFPTLRSASLSSPWFDSWNSTVSAVYRRIRSEF
ncbi:protein kinase domain-containing protein [Actinokineospora sp. NPDC004072]